MEQSASIEREKKILFWGLVVLSSAAGIGLAFFDLGWTGWALLGLSLCLRWWRITVPIAGSLLIAWSLEQFMPFSGWFTYLGMAAALVGGVLWHRAARLSASELAR